jgi:trehalose 6-phosphate synthase/trehalose 6-phosphate phosphatase
MSRAVAHTRHQNAFFADLIKSKSRVLIIDYDGTIAPFSIDRRQAVPYPGIPQLLERIITSCKTRLIVVSGRAAHEIPPLLGFQPIPEIWGAHGAERIMCDGSREEFDCSEEAMSVLVQAETLLEQQGLGDRLEVKLAAVAVHWRGLSSSRVLKIRTKVYSTLEPLAKLPNVVLADFEEGVEIRLRSANKGKALRKIISELTEMAPVAYLGDDSTDEDAFRELNGRGLTVLVRGKYRFTAAQMWLKPPDEQKEYLKDWIRACGGAA